MNCPICRVGSKPAFRHLILCKYDVQYYQCPTCGILQTEEPYWLDEAYASAIVSADTGLMQRNIYLTDVASCLLWKFFRGSGKFLDAAGGYGIFTRLMRDVGFDYFWNDPHASNLVARGFEGSMADGPYSAVTAFEVLEHLADPLKFVTQIMEESAAKTLLISTEVFDGAHPDPKKWWYYTFDTGQHITFFRRSTMQLIADKLGLNFYSNRSIHMWTDQKISPVLFKLITTPRLAHSLAMVPKAFLSSKTWADHKEHFRS